MLPSATTWKEVLFLMKNMESLLICHSRSLDSRFLWNFPLMCFPYMVPTTLPGSGAGKGGGGGGSITESGGELGKYGAAQEEGYFHRKQRQQLKKLQQQLKKTKQQIKAGRDLDQKPKSDST